MTETNALSPLLPFERGLGSGRWGVGLRVLVLSGLALVVVCSMLATSLLAGESGDVESFEMLSTRTKQRPDYKGSALEILRLVGVSEQDLRTGSDLPAGCGKMLYACVTDVGGCLYANIKPQNIHGVDSQGSLTNPLTVKPNACQCFVRSSSQPLPLAGQEGVAIGCSFTCLQSIKGTFQRFVSQHNGLHGDQLECTNVFEDMAVAAFGTRSYNANAYDSLQAIPLDDPSVIEAAKAMQVHINMQRQRECPGMPLLTTEPTLLFAATGRVSMGASQFKLELSAGGVQYSGRIASLPEDDVLVEEQGNAEDPEGLEGRYRVLSVKPGACDVHAGTALGGLAQTHASVLKHNSDSSSTWTAAVFPQLEGRTVREVVGKGGFDPLTDEERRAKTVRLAVEGFSPPTSFDARDKMKGSTQCVAFDAMDQGTCGSCYAFSAASAFSARLCHLSEGHWNTAVSPQELVDCSTRGCNGGHPLTVYEMMTRQPTVADWCDPYVGRVDVCGKTCSDGVKFRTLAQTSKILGGFDSSSSASAAVIRDAVVQMQLELMTRGPGVVGMRLYNDMFSYSTGVYKKSAGAVQVGLHAMALIGWGTDVINGKNVDYWLLQNSWGQGSGEKGIWKILRGVNEVDIELYGMTVTMPQIPSGCQAKVCSNGGQLQSDCSCKCSGSWAGQLCGDCTLECKNGGIRRDSTCECTCPAGLEGRQCEGGMVLSARAACAGAADGIGVTYSYEGATVPPTKGSFLGLYSKGETQTLKYVDHEFVCGAAASKDLCPTNGVVQFEKFPTDAGEYFVALLRYQPPNEFGQDGYHAVIPEADMLGPVTVLGGAECAPQQVHEIEIKDNVVTEVEQQVEKERQQEKVDQEAADERLQEAEPVEKKLEDRPVQMEPTLTLTGVATAAGAQGAVAGVLWSTSAPVQACYYLPTSLNTNPKHLVLYSATTGNFYSKGLIDAGPDVALPTAQQGCVAVGISPGLASGVKYVVKLQTSTFTPLVKAGFTLGYAKVGFRKFRSSSEQLALSVDWTVTPKLASIGDTVRVFNSAGAVVEWFYTSCMCKTLAEGGGKRSLRVEMRGKGIPHIRIGRDGPVPVPKGEVGIVIHRQGSVLGGYTVRFYPGGADEAAAAGSGWIDWKRIGW